jgi:hypothetical protein
MRVLFVEEEETNLAVPEIFHTIEQTSLSMWLRTSTSIFGFYFILLCHTFGLAVVVGANAIVDFRILGMAPSLPIKPLKSLITPMWTGFGINAVTGVLLLTAYPTKDLTNPDFFIKLVFVALGVITMQRMHTHVFGDPDLSEAAMVMRGKLMAKWSLFFWFGAIAAGRLLSETNRFLVYGMRWLG